MVKIIGRREIMAYAFTFTTCFLALTGSLSPEQFIPLMATIIGFYFGYRKKEDETKA